MNNDIQVGDWVEVVDSPFQSVNNGAVAQVINIRYNYGWRGNTLYHLRGLPNEVFRRHEIQKVEAR